MSLVKVTVAPGGRQFIVDAGEALQNRKGLHAVIADRLAEELQEHFKRLDARKPNRNGWPRTHFYNQIAAATAVSGVTETGGAASIADARFPIHVHGGEIRPVKAKALTIPLVPEAYGMRASAYTKRWGRQLFTIEGKNALFEKVDDGSAPSSSAPAGDSGNQPAKFPVVKGGGVRAVYALAASAKIPKDPDALPSPAVLASILQEEAQGFVDRQIRRLSQGGQA